MSIFKRILILAIAILTCVIGYSLDLPGQNSTSALIAKPELHVRDHRLALILHAAVTKDGKNAFYVYGQPEARTLRLFPVEQLEITYVNDLPANPQETCAIVPCMDMTNLHFRGLTGSPKAPEDDVLDMMAKPGASLHSVVPIPKDFI